MKVYVNVVNKKTGIYQSGMIEEPVKKGLEVDNALKHFGVSYGEVTWDIQTDNMKYGKIENTDKLVSIITV